MLGGDGSGRQCASQGSRFSRPLSPLSDQRTETTSHTGGRPPAVQGATPPRGWYSPLPLLNRVPSSIVARVPCELSDPLRRGEVTTVVATARAPEKSDALRIALRERSLAISVGASELAQVPWPAACPLVVEVKDGELRIPASTIALRTGAPGEMPIVTGLFSQLDLRPEKRRRSRLRRGTTRRRPPSGSALQAPWPWPWRSSPSGSSPQ